MDINLVNNTTFSQRNPVKRSFDWISLEDNSISNENSDQYRYQSKGFGSGFGWISFENDSANDSINDSVNDSIDHKRSQSNRRKSMKTFDWVPLGENFINVSNENTSNDFTFTVPQRLPPRLKKKLTPLKSSPARRTSIGSLRRTTFTVTPKSRTNLKFNLYPTVKKRRSSSGSSTTPRNKSSSSLSDVSTPSAASKSIISPEKIGYMSWLNVMLAPKLDVENMKIDSNKLIIECFNNTKNTLSLCPTKEDVSNETYRETVKLNQLRNAANALYRSEDMIKVNNRIKSDIEKNKYSIRRDRAIHADIGIKKHIMELLLSYNPLWLRIGLETVFNQTISLSSNDLAFGLTKFIAQNLLISKELAAKYGHKTITCFYKDENHENEAKKYILTKFLLLLNFLDRAKQVRLIEQNPCLFRIKANYKSTLELIISFARDYITGVGDITKHLRVSGFSISYKQTPIEEFDFSVSNLSTDLRCGIRLARLAELITDYKDILSQLYFPADNITRKLHNMEIALNAFNDIVPEGTIPKDIVNGHRKKTMELLNAIIFKHKTDMILKEQEMISEYVLSVQRRFRANKVMKLERERYLKLKAAVILIQRIFRANRMMKLERSKYQLLRKNTLFVQRKIRANKAMKIDRERYRSLKKSVIAIQRIFRANRAIKMERKRYEKLKKCVVFTQRRFRANKAMRSERNYYQSLRKSAIFIQNKFRANRLMKMERQKYYLIEKSVFTIQRVFRAYHAMKVERANYLKLKSSVILIQRKFRANKAMKEEREKYESIKKAAVNIQRRFRANKAMNIEREKYEKLKSSAVLIQRHFRANKAMKLQKDYYRSLVKSTLFIQTKFRANKQMVLQREQYCSLRASVLVIQQRFRAYVSMKVERNNYLILKSSVVSIQRKFRANKAMKIQREEYLKLKESALSIQRRFRANKEMKSERSKYQLLLKNTLFIQRKIRANNAMKANRDQYQLLKKSVIDIQRRFRANKAMKMEKERYEKLKKCVIFTQAKFRANKAMRSQQNYYQSLRKSVIFIQNKFRANKLMKTAREEYDSLRKTAIVIQRMFRANIAMKTEKQNYQRLKSCVILIQRKFRANKAMRSQREYYQSLIRSTVFIQTKFRANRLMKSERQKYSLLKCSTILIQRRLRAYLAMKVERTNYLKLKSSAILIQRKFRANKAMKQEREKYESIKKVAVNIQRRFRANEAMKIEREKYEKLKSSAVLIQRHFRANKAMKLQRDYYQSLVKSTLFIQTKFRANKLMKIERNNYQTLKTSVILIQRKLRAYLAMKVEKEKYSLILKSVIMIQTKFRQKRRRFAFKRTVELLMNRRQKAAILLQAHWRGYKTRKNIHEQNEKVQKAFKRIITSTSLATEDMQLGNRTYNALQKLLSYKSLLHLAYELESLDTTTKWSPESCETIVKFGAIDILIQILNESNRSEPHKKIIMFSISILLNLAKYDKTLPKLVSNSKSIEILFKIIKAFMRQNEIITKCLTLLWILMKDKTISQNIISDKRKCDTIKQILEQSKKDKTHQRSKIRMDLKFSPNWQIGKSDVYQFSDRLTGIQAIAHKMKINK